MRRRLSVSDNIDQANDIRRQSTGLPIRGDQVQDRIFGEGSEFTLDGKLFGARKEPWLSIKFSENVKRILYWAP